VLLAGKELASGDSGRNLDVGSSARSSRPTPNTRTKLRNQTLLCFMAVLLPRCLLRTITKYRDTPL
jgi:hypothetical protein